VAVCWNTVWSGGGLVARFQELPAMGVLNYPGAAGWSQWRHPSSIQHNAVVN